MRRVLGWCSVLLALGALAVPAAAENKREEKLRKDREKVGAAGFWIYHDLARGLEEAQASGKPLAVALRCVPCEECVKLDDDLVDGDRRVRPLLEQFVRVRLVATNGLDLARFQFDTDQSWLVFLMRADGTVYGRFGTRSDHREWADDVSVEGLARALEGALELHRAWPRDAEALSRKSGGKPPFPTPEAYPSLAGKYTDRLGPEGAVVPSCIHCHQVGDADRAWRRSQGTLTEEALFPYPHPKVVGLVLDPRARATVQAVTPGSPAAAAGFRAGDELKALDGQPLLSLADVQWVLHHVPAAGGTTTARVQRGAEALDVVLPLAAGWRRRDDLSWRVSSWPLRGAVLGGMKLVSLTKAERTAAGVGSSALGLRVEHVGQYPPHDGAKKAGVRKGDVLVSVDGRTDLPRETDLLRWALLERTGAAPLAVVLRRDGKRLELSVPVR